MKRTERTDCIYYFEYFDMGAHIPCCEKHKGLGNCPCEECNEYADKHNSIEPCNDCISREYLKENMQKYGWQHPDSTVSEYVESLPSVQPIRSWILTSERLPDVYGTYIITYREKWENYDWDYDVEIADFRDDNLWYPYSDICKGEIVEIYAWMPLPEPYREEKNEISDSDKRPDMP